MELRAGGPAGVTVVVTADGPIATYESFTLPDPPRLVLDIPNATHAVPQPIPANPPAITAIRSSQYRERPVKIVRLVFDLRSPLPYRVETSENRLRVQLGVPGGPEPIAQAGSTGSPQAMAASSASAPGGAAATSAPAGKVTRVDLQIVRGRQRIVIGTSGRVGYTVDEASEPPSLTVDVTGATIDPAAARSLDLRQVASPVSRLRTSQFRTGPDPVVRIVADLRSPARYDVQKTGSAIVVELQGAPPAAAFPAAPAPVPVAAERPVPPMAAGAPSTQLGAGSVPPPPVAAVSAGPPAGPANGRISMDFKDADINNLLRIIAEVSGMNVVAGSDVSGKVTVRLVNVEWQQALDVILKINNMGYELDGNIIRVAPLGKLQAERRAREDARSAAAKAQRDEEKTKTELEPLETRVIAVNYAKAGEVVKNLDRLKTLGRPDASIAVDDRTNKLIVKETRGTLDKMVDLLKQLDQATPQVLIEARLVESTRSFSQSLGVEYGFVKNATAGSRALSVFTSQVGTNIQVPDGSTANPIPIAISFPAGGTSPIGIGFSLLGEKGALLARLSAAESEQKIKTLSAPKVATLDNQEAEIRQGSQVPYTTVDSSGRTVVAFQDAFIRLKVTPHITNDRRVSMKVEAERTFPGARIDFAGGFAFQLQQRKATTNVLASNGATIVIGGLLQTDDSVSDTGIPWLMRVPVLGAFFKSHSIGPNDRTELLIFLTPTILEEPRLS
ncbi:MAG TPA: type IV pilus secretin PilQ [Candidatus Methylomirabilis sp.]|nr:type IV pilus secretin PilQ [Candidatus Methylomirabilis sp.]